MVDFAPPPPAVMHRNNLTGSIPVSWIGLEEDSTLRHFLRQELDVIGNNLSGPVPPWLVSLAPGSENNVYSSVEYYNKYYNKVG